MATMDYINETAEDIMEDYYLSIRKEQEMTAEVEECKKKFREACNDMIAYMHSLDDLHAIIDEEWNNFRYLKNDGSYSRT